MCFREVRGQVGQNLPHQKTWSYEAVHGLQQSVSICSSIGGFGLIDVSRSHKSPEKSRNEM
jgi:hypothetical protein